MEFPDLAQAQEKLPVFHQIRLPAIFAEPPSLCCGAA
jgi:hypothetical protein